MASRTDSGMSGRVTQNEATSSDESVKMQGCTRGR
jgi:hypothetical protein